MKEEENNANTIKKVKNKVMNNRKIAIIATWIYLLMIFLGAVTTGKINVMTIVSVLFCVGVSFYFNNRFSPFLLRVYIAITGSLFALLALIYVFQLNSRPTDWGLVISCIINVVLLVLIWRGL